MNVLHLFSNAKWTGPAEPALNLCVALRRLGVEADFACAPNAGASINKVVETARDRGIEPILRFHLSKHRNPITNAHDRRALAKFLKSKNYDLIHCHLDNDHRIALKPATRQKMPVVRSSYKGTGFHTPSTAAALLPATAALIEPSKMALENDEKMFHFPRRKMYLIPGAVDTERFDPTRELPDARRWLGIPNDAFVVGIVARLQTHRHYEEFFLAIRRLVSAVEKVHAIVVGRGTRQQTVGQDSAGALGLGARVHFPGYVDGENYVGMLKAFDVKVFLVPGTDGTCRALREAMAMGKPGVVARRGMLPEIIEHETNGLVCDGSTEALFHALHRLATHKPETRALGRAARQKALRVFSLDTQAQAVRAVYQAVLHPPPQNA